MEQPLASSSQFVEFADGGNLDEQPLGGCSQLLYGANAASFSARYFFFNP
jgi:hypothetical protein